MLGACNKNGVFYALRRNNLAAGTFNSAKHNAVVLVSAATGQVLRQLSMTSRIFAQPVFAGGKLLIASETGGLSAWQP